MKEKDIVTFVSEQLIYKKRPYYNVHGSMFSKSGTPDILTMDDKSVFLGIEVKQQGKTPTVNQWRNLIEILKAGGRSVVAQEDFNIDLLFNNQLPIIEVGKNLGTAELVASKLKVVGSHEIKLKGGF